MVDRGLITDDTVASHRNIAMLGEGFYSRVSQGPRAVIDNTADLVFDALDRMDRAGSLGPNATATGPFAVADYGSADGGTSLGLMRRAVQRVRHAAPDRPIVLHYTDLPGADFATLFRGVDDAEGGISGEADDVHVLASGRSFYRQILPIGSLHLGFSASAMHYLSRMPGIVADHVHAVGATPAEQTAFRAVALDDWSTILAHRGRELAVGGRLVMANFCIDHDGHHLGNTGGHSLFDTYNRLWQGLADDGIITGDEYRATAFQQFYKSIDDTLAPFEDADGVARRAGLRIETAEPRTVECPFRLAFERGELDTGQFAREFVNTHRSWTETTFRAGLDEIRPAEERQRILDELYQRYEHLVRAAPAGHGKDLVHLYLVAHKTGA